MHDVQPRLESNLCLFVNVHFSESRVVEYSYGAESSNSPKVFATVVFPRSLVDMACSCLPRHTCSSGESFVA